MESSEKDPELVPEAILEKDGLKVSKSPWGPEDEIGRLNWITPERTAAILGHLDGAHVFDLNVDYFIGMPSWIAAGDPTYGIWMTHTPQGSVNDNLSGSGSQVHEKYSYCGDAIQMYTHCGTHIDTLNHLGHHGTFWNGWTPESDLGSRVWHKGGRGEVPADDRARRPARRRRDARGRPASSPATRSPRRTSRTRREAQGVELRKGDVVLVPHGPHDGLARRRRLPRATRRASGWTPRSGCARRPARCASRGDTISLEVMPPGRAGVFLPVHAYMFSTAGAQIIEVVDMEEIAAEKQYEFAFLGFPLQAARRDGRADAVVRGAAEGLGRPQPYTGCESPRPHGLAVMTPPFHGGNRGFESRWGYCSPTPALRAPGAVSSMAEREAFNL